MTRNTFAGIENLVRFRFVTIILIRDPAAVTPMATSFLMWENLNNAHLKLRFRCQRSGRIQRGR